MGENNKQKTDKHFLRAMEMHNRKLMYSCHRDRAIIWLISPGVTDLLKQQLKKTTWEHKEFLTYTFFFQNKAVLIVQEPKSVATSIPAFLMKHRELQVSMLALLNSTQDNVIQFHLKAAKYQGRIKSSKAQPCKNK